MMTSMIIETVVPDKDTELLHDSYGLKVSDLRREIPLRLIGIRDVRGLVWLVGVESYGYVAFLCSLAVRMEKGSER